MENTNQEYIEICNEILRLFKGYFNNWRELKDKIENHTAPPQELIQHLERMEHLEVYKDKKTVIIDFKNRLEKMIF